MSDSIYEQLGQLEATYNAALEAKDAEIERLKALLTRAADELELTAKGGKVIVTGSTAFLVEIQALRKLLAEKDAEIERLKLELHNEKHKLAK